MDLRCFGRRVTLYGLSLAIAACLPVRTGENLTDQAITISALLPPEPMIIDAATYGTTTLDTSFSFSSDGKTVYFARATDRGPYQIMQSEYVDGAWKSPARPEFAMWRSTSEGSPFISADGTRIFYWSYVPDSANPGHNSNIWSVVKTPTGWGRPEAVNGNVNSPAREYTAGITTDGVLYFTSNRQQDSYDFDIYCARLVNGRYVAERLDDNVNSPYREQAACIAPDESFIVFTSDRPGGDIEYDLYISYLRNGVWTPAQKLGLNVEMGGLRTWPTISPDGQYLFFSIYRENEFRSHRVKLTRAAL